ncbi:MAG: TetR/AcrR family transcriptional regulator [Gemmatimonadaceae bacterium]
MANRTKRSSPKPPTSADDLETRERILAAAHRVFLRLGTAKARTVDIAEEAGVNKALLHYYFATKANLANAVFAASVSQLMPRIFAILGDPALSIAQKVHDIVREQIDFHGSRPYVAGYIISEMHTEPDRLRAIVSKVGPPPLGALSAQLDAEAAAGRMRQISAEMFVVNLMGLVVFPFITRPLLGILFALEGDRFSAFLEERKRVLPEIFLASLRP